MSIRLMSGYQPSTKQKPNMHSIYTNLHDWVRDARQTWVPCHGVTYRIVELLLDKTHLHMALRNPFIFQSRCINTIYTRQD